MVKSVSKKSFEEYSLNSIFFENTDLNQADRALIKKAYDFAELAHRGIKRKSGEPYFIHLVATAKNLAFLGMDGTVIAAGLLHDSIEDGVATEEQIKKEFGNEIAFLVEGVTKLGHVRFKGMRRHNESLRKLFVATSKDIRVLIIKFADRIHNLETLKFIETPEKRKRIATESLEIYSPLAYRLGISAFSKRLGDLAFPHVMPEEYKRVKEILKERSKENVKNLEQFRRSISKKLAENKIIDFKITHRVKTLVALYKKLIKNDWNDEKIYDIIALRIMVKDIADCYQVLGIIHKNFKPMIGRIKDYIAVPKLNGYRSIHTTIFTGHGGVIEVQIRTERMHQEAEYGIASHLSYKAKTVGVEGIRKNQKDWVSKIFGMFSKNSNSFTIMEESKKENEEDNHKWIHDLAICSDRPEEDDFEYHLKEDFFSDRIFVFTPLGEVIDLPVGATPVDFAYHIHTAMGETITGAKINDNFKSLDTVLKTGDIIDILAKKGATPNIKWLEFVKTSMAKRKIRAFWERKKREN